MTAFHRRSAMTMLALACTGTSTLLLRAGTALAQSEQQHLVDRARIVVEEFQADQNLQRMRVYMQNAYATLIVPDLLKLGIFVGAEYGTGVLLARDVTSGEWSEPAFFEVIGGSLGLQFGGKTSDVILTVMNRGAFDKMLSTNFKMGTDASVAVGPVGIGIGAGTTVQFGEDIYIFSRDKGLYGGLSVEGSRIAPKSDWNKLYYGQTVSSIQILLERMVAHTGTAELRQQLTKF